MFFIVAFWVVAIYIVLCVAISQSLPLTIIVSIIWIAICFKIAFTDNKTKNEKLKFKIFALIICCSLTALPIGLSIKETIQENEHQEIKCLDSNCDRERETERNSYYCYRHTCRYNNCTNKKEWREKYCSYHQTSNISYIQFTNIEVEEYESGVYGSSYYKAKIIHIPNDLNIIYATITFYRGNKIVYQDYDFLYCTFKDTHQSTKTASILISHSKLPTFDKYEWSAYMSKPKKIGVE